MRQKHLKGKEMKPLSRLWKAILKSYKSAVLECSSFQLFFMYLFTYLFIYLFFYFFIFLIKRCVYSFPSELTA